MVCPSSWAIDSPQAGQLWSRSFPVQPDFDVSAAAGIGSISGVTALCHPVWDQPPLWRRKSTMASVVLKNGFDRDFLRYLREINGSPTRPAETEFGPAVRSPEPWDMNAAHGLVTSRLRLVANLAAGSRGRGPRFGGSIADRNMEPIPANGRFDPDHGFRLASRALRWIRAAAGHGLACPMGARRS
jgi:DNA-directed RNA polymerase sigma subunit (sigma70/sigma32)